MLFNRAMCIMCHTKPGNSCFKIRSGAAGICADCFNKLSPVGKTTSFAAIKSADFIISPFYYKNPLKEAIYEYKFRGCYAYAGIFAELMKSSLSPLSFLSDFDALIPVPISQKRMTERGYNQSSLIAKPLADFLGIDYREDFLIRNRNTKRQSELKNYARLANVTNAFSADKSVKDKSIIVFDDIYTTGLTMEECAKTLKAAGAKSIIGMTLAIVEKSTVPYEARLI